MLDKVGYSFNYGQHDSQSKRLLKKPQSWIQGCSGLLHNLYLFLVEEWIAAAVVVAITFIVYEQKKKKNHYIFLKEGG